MNSTSLEHLFADAKAALARHDYHHALKSLLAVFDHSPLDADIAFLIANTCRDCGDMKQAAQWLRTAAELRPSFFAAYCNLGAAEQELGNSEAAITALEKALQINPDSVEALCNCAQTYRFTGEDDRALHYYQKAISLQPGHALLRVWYAEAAAALGRNDHAEAALLEGLIRIPGNGELLCAMGRLCLSMEDFPRAKEYLIQALQANPQLAGAHFALGTVMREWNHLDEAATCYLNTLRFAPQDIHALVNIGEVLQRAGCIDESEGYLHRALEIDPHCRPAWHNLLVSMTYNSRHTAGEILAAHGDWGRTIPDTPPVKGPKRHDSDRIRIGICSPDFCGHPAAAFLLPMFEHRTRREFDLFCYVQNTFTDDTTERFRRLADHWTPIGKLDDAAVAQCISDDGIDILLDTAGHFSGNRLEMFALHPAPLQIGGIGYPGPTGCRAIDYRISDRIIDPPEIEPALPDHPLLLPNGFCCYRPPDTLAEVTALPAEHNGFITFGSLHTTARLNRTTVELWSAALRAVPDSRMSLFRDTLTPATVERLSGWFDECGIARGRVSFSSTIPPQGHLHLYTTIDILLDTTPWSGHTTACEALVMGVPVITPVGDRHAGRMVASVLTAADLEEWVAGSPDTYVAIAQKLSDDIGRMTTLRTSLRSRILSSPLCDGQLYMRTLEEKFRELLNG